MMTVRDEDSKEIIDMLIWLDNCMVKKYIHTDTLSELIPELKELGGIVNISVSVVDDVCIVFTKGRFATERKIIYHVDKDKLDEFKNIIKVICKETDTEIVVSMTTGNLYKRGVLV